jgi:pyruvate formate lyase activating enzyme
MATRFASLLDSLTVPGTLYRPLGGGKIECYACGHRCRIPEGRRGICRVRFNAGGQLRVPDGYVAGLQCDPIEKKPLFHVCPGAVALTFGMLGCNLHCPFCQNWHSSQVLRDPEAAAGFRQVELDQLLGSATRSGARVVTSSYNEPMITAEWAHKIFQGARRIGLRTAFVSNGYASSEALEFLRPHLDCLKIDLKCMRDRNYRRLGGRLSVVLETIKQAHKLGLWVELVTLLVPGFNDSREEVGEAAEFIAGVSHDIPWHVTAFHPDYQMDGLPCTSVAKLLEAAEIGRAAGLHFVYAGNLPGSVREWENTYCPGCRRLLVERRGFSVRIDRLSGSGVCPDCRRIVPGVWN